MKPSGALRIVASALLAGALGLLAGCAQGPVFPEYFYPGTDELVNLVSDLAFSADWTVGLAGAASADDPATYLAFEDAAADASAAGIAPPSPGSPVEVSREIYRLEVRNLATGGDFSGLAVGDALGGSTAGWVYWPGAEPGAVHEIVDGSNSHAIHGKTLHVKTATRASRLDYALGGLADGFLPGATYLVRFSYRAADYSTVVLEFRDSEGPVDDVPWVFFAGTDGYQPSDLDNLLEFPPPSVRPIYDVLAPDGGAPYYLSFGSEIEQWQTSQDAYIDDFRVVRADRPPRAELRLTYALTLPRVDDGSQRYTAKAGSYRFSFYVHDDPTVGSAPDRYLCRALTVTVAGGNVDGDAAPIEEAPTTSAVFARGETGWPGADSAGWALVSLQTGSLPLAATDSPDAAVILVTITPADCSSQGGLAFDAGSVLVSSPILEFTGAIDPAGS